MKKTIGTALDRREFVKLTAGYLAGLGLVPLGAGPLTRRAALGAAGVPLSARDGLPPRTVGLRTLGGDFRFDPAGLRIEPGTPVVWLNMGDFHTATAFHPQYADLLQGDVPLRIPEGAEPWHSGMLGLTGGTEFEHRFDIEGVYDYFCQPHYSFGMVGRIIVGRPQNGPALQRPLSELNQALQAAMPSVDEITGPAGRTYEWAARINGVLLLSARDKDPRPALSAVRRGVDQDATLQKRLGAAGLTDAFDSALERFQGEVGDGDNYEAQVASADGVKDVLRRAHRAG